MPSLLPTLALVSGENVEAVGVDLLHRRYRGYIVPSEDAQMLKRALAAVRRGEIWARREVLTRIFDSFAAPQLTAREEEIIRLVAQGLSNRAIANQLGITERTVKTHVSNLFIKLGIGNRTELIMNSLNHFYGASK
jgi:RNA polymerase sigma factor (sigma-70 family)